MVRELISKGRSLQVARLNAFQALWYEEKGDVPGSGGGIVPRFEWSERTCSHAEVVEWVSRVMEDKGVVASQAPSPVAWSMLQWSRSAESNRTQFWTRLYMELMPSKAERDVQRRQLSDGQETLELIDRVEGAFERASRGSL